MEIIFRTSKCKICQVRALMGMLDLLVDGDWDRVPVPMMIKRLIKFSSRTREGIKCRNHMVILLGFQTVIMTFELNSLQVF